MSKVRTKFMDGIYYDDYFVWENFRYMAFAHRPNIRLRTRIRHSFAKLIQLKETTDLSDHESFSMPKSLLKFVDRMTPCLTMHVRHGDSGNDWRSKIKLDRSFNAHVNCSNALLQELGIYNIYLASDDPDVRDVAAKSYPEYNWFTMNRPLRQSNLSFDYIHEKSKQQEMANIYVSFILKRYLLLIYN